MADKWRLLTPVEKSAFQQSAKDLKTQSETHRKRALQAKATGLLLIPNSPTAQPADNGSHALGQDLFMSPAVWTPSQLSTGIPVVRPLTWNSADSLGKGRFACVVKAADKLSGETFALKLSTPEFEDCLAVEFDFLATSNHPNLIRAFGFIVDRHGRVGDFSAMVMELAKESLEQWIIRRRCQPVVLPEDRSMAGHMWIQLLHGAGYIHSREVVHCDIKPANVMVKLSGIVCLADLGLLHKAGSNERGQRLYTTNYRPWECAVAAGGLVIVAPSMDVWAMACLLYDIAAHGHQNLNTSLFDGLAATEHNFDIVRMRGLAIGRCNRYCLRNAGVNQVLKACIVKGGARPTISDLLGIHVDLKVSD